MKNQKKQQKQPQFNQYWIFGSIVLVFLLLNIFSGGGSQSSATTTPSKFFEYASKGDVERIEIVNKREVFVYLTREIHPKIPYYQLHPKTRTTDLNLEIYKTLKTSFPELMMKTIKI